MFVIHRLVRIVVKIYLEDPKSLCINNETFIFLKNKHYWHCERLFSTSLFNFTINKQKFSFLFSRLDRGPLKKTLLIVTGSYERNITPV